VADPVRAAGALLWRSGEAGPLVAVVHRPRYDDWSLPKGKLDDDEPWPVAACREVLEETGFTGPLGRDLGSTRYDVLLGGALVPKTVQWWSLEAEEGAFTPTAEVDELLWLPVREARRRLDPSRDGAVLARFVAGPPRSTTVLLVRHATAGDRGAWSGPDLLRPLDDDGRAQADRLATALAPWRPQRVVSAPPLRCRQTVEGLGLPVEEDSRFGEDGFDLAVARDALTRLAAEVGRGCVVVCSQGGAIPALVAELAGATERVRARKGSTWVLSVDDGRLVGAGYLREP
jgi:broad specificity phosphatase PhoE/8-oxo-dGTP pyrophosphatase MutT (NUDIX family)